MIPTPRRFEIDLLSSGDGGASTSNIYTRGFFSGKPSSRISKLLRIYVFQGINIEEVERTPSCKNSSDTLFFLLGFVRRKGCEACD